MKGGPAWFKALIKEEKQLKPSTPPFKALIKEDKQLNPLNPFNPTPL